MRFLDAILPAPKPVRSERRSSFTFGGYGYNGIPIQTTWGKTPAETIGSNFEAMVDGALKQSAVVSAVEMVRLSVFSQARFRWQRTTNGRPGDMFGTEALSLLERPWVGGTTSDLLAKMILHADFAGNAYVARLGDELVLLRPDWTDIVLAPRVVDLGNESAEVGFKRVGYAYYQGGDRTSKTPPVVFLPTEVAHFAPMPDPCANYRGMSWLTPVLREVESDKQATEHKSKFFENAATPNLAVTLPKEIDPNDFDLFVESMERSHKGAENAYKTLYLAGGADPTVIGANFQQLDFKATQGAGETRIAAASGVGSIIANLSEGMQGSSLNAGNYTAAKRRFGDITMRQLWTNAASSLEVVVPPPPAAYLVVDDRGIAFLRDDQSDRAQVAASEAQIIRTLGDGGWTPESIKAAMAGDYDWSLLQPSGLLPVQLQPPGSGATPSQA